MHTKETNGESAEGRDAERKRSLSTQESLRPIPIPASAIWREVRMRVVPAVVFVASLVVAAWLWQEHGANGTFVGSAEGVRALVTSPFVGTVQYLNVSPYQEIKKGDPVGVIVPIDPRAQVDLLRSRMQAASSRLEPSLAQRNAVDYERLYASVLSLKVELSKDKVGLQRAENELKRNEELFRTKLVSEDVYDLTLKNRDMLLTEVTEKQKSVTELEASLARLRQLSDPSFGTTNRVSLEAIDELETQLMLAATNWGPLTLTAPISGVVSYVFRGPGENIREGEPLVVIQASQPERIVGYLRQPFPFEPEAGMKVEVKTRSRRPQLALSEIRQVGTNLEPITNSLAMERPGILVDMGLPVVVNLPPGLLLRAGEMVDLIVRPTTGAMEPSVGRGSH